MDDTPQNPGFLNLGSVSPANDRIRLRDNLAYVHRLVGNTANHLRNQEYMKILHTLTKVTQELRKIIDLTHGLRIKQLHEEELARLAVLKVSNR